MQLFQFNCNQNHWKVLILAGNVDEARISLDFYCDKNPSAGLTRNDWTMVAVLPKLELRVFGMPTI